MTEGPDFNVRDAVIADAEVIADFNSRLAMETEDLRLDAATIVRGVKRVLGDPSKGRYFVAELKQGGEPIACTMITYEFSDWRDADLWWFQSVYVRADWRRRGVFRALYQHVRGAALAAGAGGLRLYVEKENVTAQQTYEAMGMRRSPYLVMSELFRPTGTHAFE